MVSAIFVGFVNLFHAPSGKTVKFKISSTQTALFRASAVYWITLERWLLSVKTTGWTEQESSLKQFLPISSSHLFLNSGVIFHVACQ